MNKIEFNAKLPLEYKSILESIIDDVDTIKKFSNDPLDDEEACSLAYGKTIWQKFLYPLLKEAADELGIYPTDLVQDINNWFDHCHM